ncbi:aminopeptidase [Desulfosporosinus hippei]|uniref:Aminopeptidase n=1 Tax=Desulfosporosinus hippei DSM 8344 TaxID=1121419 RepID=A0A1G8JDI8_9FIRM|nr:aminopeptidase [Desulfosporosinus hippei]SDI29344.1 aminopeptidase [Desulfosporosinus hippei DSM 8344]
MRDSRIEKLADSLINYSISLQPGEKILIEVIGPDILLAQACVRYAYQAGGVPFLSSINHTLLRELLKELTVEQAEAMTRWDRGRMKEMQAYIGIRGGDNVNEWSDVPNDCMKIYTSYYQKPVHSEQRVPHTRWCVLRYPNAAMAQLANTSIEGFEDFYFKVCNLDYSKMSKAMDPLKELMEKTDRVHIVGPGTDLEFSIKGMPAIKCDGHLNIPDGEIFSAPLKESVNGRISYNTPSLYQGFTYDNIVLEFEKGRIVKATANDSERIESVFNTDEGARYVGEFAIGVNPYISTPMRDTLFDEKIDGSFHFTPGSCYDECNNGNKSAIHWDLVCIQRPDYGGGEIFFDGVLVRKDGRFVLPELEALNPENLRG